ncbi:armadillo-type protein [Coprinopsis sp. MPI-PUGE-AT-0042]|nr:armadillo-type protein [Coprinopsis sp. MPI-PUGE-AT-0042]
MMTEDIVSSQSGSTTKGSQQDDLLIEETPPSSSMGFYPSHQINKQLLELTSADIAITHDDWRLGLEDPRQPLMFGLREDIASAVAGNAEMVAASGDNPSVAYLHRGDQTSPDCDFTRGNGEKHSPVEGGKKQAQGSLFPHGQTLAHQPVAPPWVSYNRWYRRFLVRARPNSPNVVERKVTGLLNKLTMENFGSISDQIIAWANKSEKEQKGRTLIQVIRLVFNKATDEAIWSETYARLCRKIMEQISPKVQDEGIKNQEGKPIGGGQLFRKYLLNRCQEDFERGWTAKDATAATTATKAADDEAVKTLNVDKEVEKIKPYSEEYYAAAKAKRQGLGLVKFIGELFKFQMLTERIMHECVKKLLGNVENPEEEEIESLCKLLTTIGHLLDTPKAQGHMDIYFSRIEELTKSNKVSKRLRFMLQDVIELRARKWVPRNPAVEVPTSMTQASMNFALREKTARDRKNTQRLAPTSRNPKAGDLSNFSKIANKGQPISFGPSSVFSKTSKAEKRESESRTAHSTNMFSMLQNDVASEPKPEPQRKRLALMPRSVPKDDASSAAAPESDEEDGAKAAPDMSEADAKKKVAEDCKELFAVRNIDESENYFTSLPAKYHIKLVDKLVSTAVESKAADAKLVVSVFERALSKRLVAASVFEEGLAAIAEFLEDIAIDAPHAYELFALMVNGVKLDTDVRARIAAKDAGSKLPPLLS